MFLLENKSGDSHQQYCWFSQYIERVFISLTKKKIIGCKYPETFKGFETKLNVENWTELSDCSSDDDCTYLVTTVKIFPKIDETLTGCVDPNSAL